MLRKAVKKTTILINMNVLKPSSNNIKEISSSSHSDEEDNA